MTGTPRALVLDLFGDYLRYVGAEVRLGHLTTLLEAFDVAPATVRVTMSRLRREGWFSVRRIGRETVYVLAPHMLDLLDEGRLRIFAEPPAGWSGAWTMVIYQLSEAERPERETLRKDLAWHGFGPLSTSTWVAPGDRRDEVAPLLVGFAEDRLDVFECRTGSLEADRSLAQRCWDLPALAEEYAGFLRTCDRLSQDVATLTGARALVARTELISTYRHFPFKDPGLPAPLQPDGWPGERARLAFRDLHERLGVTARSYVEGVLER